MEAYFAGGCFWCMAKPYNSIEGVISVESGYSGGYEEDPAYEDVKAQKTHHRETVKIVYDEDTVSFEELLKVYFYNIDPFDEDGQFIDRGRSYSCAVYYQNESEYSTSLEMIERIEKEHSRKVFVSLEKFIKFYKAEEYHQDYALKNPNEYEEEYISSGRALVKEEDKIKL